MKKLKSNKCYILVALLILIVVVAVFFVLGNDKNEKAKKDALVLSNMAVRKYIEDKEYDKEDNVARVYDLIELDGLETVLECPLNNKLYEKDSYVSVNYDQSNKDLTVQTQLYCGKHIINYNCDTKNDVYKSDCTLEIDKR